MFAILESSLAFLFRVHFFANYFIAKFLNPGLDLLVQLVSFSKGVLSSFFPGRVLTSHHAVFWRLKISNIN